jgi:carbamoyltransferase
MNILGIACGHDACACLISDGVIVADAAEERFSRVKHMSGFPAGAIKFCLNAGNITAQEIDFVVIAGRNFPPHLLRRFTLSREQEEALTALFPAGSNISQQLERGAFELPLYYERIELAPRCRIVCLDHHLAHAAAAHFTRGSRERCVILTLDGIGDRISTAIWTGEENEIALLRSWGQEASLGWFYGLVTEALGWHHGDGEGTTMGFAPYGDPEKVGDRLDRFHPVFADGELSHRHEFGQASWISDRGQVHFHLPEAEEVRQIADLVGAENVAARAQQIIEHQVLHLVRHWTQAVGVRRLACGGGLFLNVKLNQRVWYETDLEEQWIYPNPGDAGLAIGAALQVWHQTAQPKSTIKTETLYHGPQFDDEEIRQLLDARGLEYRTVPDPSRTAAQLLAEGKIVAWFQGRMESGPRALGNRSILMAADKAENKDTINSKVKFREGFRPFCPSILAEKQDEYLQRGREEPFMITSFDVQPGKRAKVPAVVHVDGTLRPQTVTRAANPLYYDLIKYFGDLTGEYLVLDTSFNIKGEPIVCNPREAIRCFYDTGIDALVMGSFLLSKPGFKSRL